MRKIFQIILLLFLLLIVPVFSALPPKIPIYKIICDINVLNQTIYNPTETTYYNQSMITYLETIRCAGCYGYATLSSCTNESSRYLDDIFPEKTIIKREHFGDIYRVDKLRVNKTYRILGDIGTYEEEYYLSYYEILNDTRDLFTIANEKYKVGEKVMSTGIDREIVIVGLILLFIIVPIIVVSLIGIAIYFIVIRKEKKLKKKKR